MDVGWQAGSRDCQMGNLTPLLSPLRTAALVATAITTNSDYLYRGMMVLSSTYSMRRPPTGHYLYAHLTPRYSRHESQISPLISQ